MLNLLHQRTGQTQLVHTLHVMGGQVVSSPAVHVSGGPGPLGAHAGPNLHFPGQGQAAAAVRQQGAHLAGQLASAGRAVVNPRAGATAGTLEHPISRVRRALGLPG